MVKIFQNIDKKKKIGIISVGVIILLALLFILTPLKKVFISDNYGGGKVGTLIKQANDYVNMGDYDRALDRLDEAEQLNPTDSQRRTIRELRLKIVKLKQQGIGDETEVQKLIRHAKQNAGDGDYETAISLLKKARTINDSSANPDMAAREEIKRLLELYAQLMRRQSLSDNPDDLLRRARTAVREGDFETALNLVRRAQRAYDAQNLNNPALNRRIQDSNRIYTDRMREQSLRDNPRRLIQEARNSAANNDYDSAFRLLRRARRANNASNNPDSNIENEITQLENSLNKRQRIQSLRDNPEELVRRAENAASSGDYDQAIEFLIRAQRANNMRSNPDSALNDKINKLLAEYKRRQAEQAQTDNPREIIARARQAAQNGDYDSALRLLSRANRANAARRNPNPAITAEITRLRNAYQRQQANNALASDPLTLIRDAQRHAQNGDYERALDTLAKARKANNMRPNPSSSIDERITRLERQYRQAMDEQTRRDNPVELVARARQAAESNDFETAISLLRRARRANNARTNPDAELARQIDNLENEYTERLNAQARRDNPRELITQANRMADQGNWDDAHRYLRRAQRANNARRNPDQQLDNEINRLAQSFRDRQYGRQDNIARTNDSGTDGSSADARTSRTDRVDTGRTGRPGVSQEELNRILEAERQRMQQNQQRNQQQADENQKAKLRQYLQEGNAALRAGDNNRAVAAFNRALQIDENNAQANSGAARAHLRNRNFPDALRHATRAISLNPNDADAHTTRGEVFFQNRQDDAAQNAFETAVSLNPNSALAYYRLGVIYLIKRMNAKAKRAFIMATKASDFSELSQGDRSKCYYNLGKANERLQSFPEAITAYKNSLKLETDNYKSLISIGQIQYIQSNYTGAIDSFNRANAIKSTYHAHFWLGKTYDTMKNYAKAIEEYKKSLESSPENYESLFNLGRVYALSGNNTLAQEQYTKAGEKHGYNSKLYVQIGNSYLMVKNFAKATEAYKQALAKNSRETEAYIGLGRTLEEQGDIPGAIVNLKEGTGLTQDSALYAKLGELYFKIREYDQAITAFGNALERSANNVRYRRLIADVYFAKKDYKNAATAYEKVISLNPMEWIAYHRLGDSYLEMRMIEAAKLIYKKLIDKNPSYERIDIIRAKFSQLQGGS